MDRSPRDGRAGLTTITVEEIGVKLPFAMLGLEVDNDSAFINETVVDYCKDRRQPFRAPVSTSARSAPGSATYLDATQIYAEDGHGNEGQSAGPAAISLV